MVYCDIENLNTVFLNDAELSKRKLKRYWVGQLHISSGKLVACDPFVNPQTPAFTRTVPQRGDFTVEVIEPDTPGHYALAVLWLLPAAQITPKTLTGEMAKLASQDTNTLSDDEFFGYPVDAGTGCFMDADTFTAIEQVVAQYDQTHPDQERYEGDYTAYSDFLMDAFYPQTQDASDSNTEDRFQNYKYHLIYHPLENTHPANLAVFVSGWGDGMYPSYWAVDEAGQAVALVTDFMMIENGTDEDEQDREEREYEENLSSEKRTLLETLYQAVEANDMDALRRLCNENGYAIANEIVPSTGETAISSAIRLDLPQALEILLNHQAVPDMPERNQLKGAFSTYLGYAKFLGKKRKPEIYQLLSNANLRQ